MNKNDSLDNNTDSYIKMYAQESTKEIIKARISGKVFRMPDFEKIQANPQQYEGEIQRWKTAIKKALKDDTRGYGKKHMFAWGPEDDKPDDKYSELPENGVPSNKTELVALLNVGRLGPKYVRMKRKITDEDSEFDEIIKILSGGLVETFAEYMKVETNKEISKQVDMTRLTLSAALNNEMEVPFMKGQYPNYKAVMDWVNSKTEIEKKTEYMYELFKHIDDALAGDGQADSKCMEFRMAMELLYIDQPIQFKDWEHSDVKAEIFEAENYTPSISFMFFYLLRQQIGVELWKKIEEEFRREITTENYNKLGWMKNKPTLFKIIKKMCKNQPKAKIASLVETSNNANDGDSDDEVEIDMEDGMVLKVQPKFKGGGQTWKRNFTKKFNLQQSGNNRWQRRPYQHNQQQSQPRRQNQFNRNQNHNGNRNFADQQNQDTPNPDQWWKCPKCREEGNPRKYKGNQLCPKHNYRPKFFESIPLASVREVKPNNIKVDNNENDNNNPNGHLNSIRDCLYNDSDSTISN